jgi:hypothetical protein
MQLIYTDKKSDEMQPVGFSTWSVAVTPEASAFFEAPTRRGQRNKERE